MSLKRPSGGVLVVGGLVVAGFLGGLLFTSALEWRSSDSDAPAPGATLTLAATAYCKGTITAAGVTVHRGIAAADPQVLPAGTVVSLSTGQREFDGVYTVLDTGPRVQGKLLDLYVWSCQEALDFGRREVRARVLRLGWDPRASAESLVDRLFRRRNSRAGTAAPNATTSSDGQDPSPPATRATDPLPEPSQGPGPVDAGTAPTIREDDAPASTSPPATTDGSEPLPETSQSRRP